MRELDLDLLTGSDTIAAARAAVADAEGAPSSEMPFHLGTLLAHTKILAAALERAHAALTPQLRRAA